MFKRMFLKDADALKKNPSFSISEKKMEKKIHLLKFQIHVRSATQAAIN